MASELNNFKDQTR